VGVSARVGSVGRIILDNLAASTLGADGLRIIKPGVEEMEGIACLPDLAALRAWPADVLVLSLPAQATLEAVEELITQGGGAEVVYLVAGGIGDGADKEGYGARLEARLAEARAAGLWTPRLVGPNGLGMLSAAARINTLFIPESRLPVRLDPESPVAFISQSGAFLITRVSRDARLALRYGFCIGNQLDVSCAHLLQALFAEEGVRVAGVYAEGFKAGDLAALCQEVQRWVADGRQVVFYKGGRTQAGMRAAAGHTGAMAGDYALQARALRAAGAVLTESFADFSGALRWLAAYPQLAVDRIAVLSNAGYETVASQDAMTGTLRAHALTEAAREQLAAAIAGHKLGGLVAATLPLDVTPMADEGLYAAATATLAASGAQVVVVGLVPLTQRLGVFDAERSGAFAAELRAAATASGCAVGVVVDSGKLYEGYRDALAAAGLPLFDSVEEALGALRVVADAAAMQAQAG